VSVENTTGTKPVKKSPNQVINNPHRQSNLIVKWKLKLLTSHCSTAVHLMKLMAISLTQCMWNCCYWSKYKPELCQRVLEIFYWLAPQFSMSEQYQQKTKQIIEKVLCEFNANYNRMIW